MALQKVPKSLIFDKGLDTKTNEKLTDGYLDLENCDVFNVGLQKSKGYEAVSRLGNIDNNYTKNIFTSQTQLAIAANNSIYEQDLTNNVAIPRGNFTYLERDLILTQSNGQNISNVQHSTPLFYSEFGAFGAYIYKTGTTYYLRIQNIESVITLNILNINDFEGIGHQGVPVGVICTRTGVFVYTQEVDLSIDEFFIPYTSATTTAANFSIILVAKQVTFAGGTCAYSAFKVLTITSDGGSIWIGYFDNAGEPNVLIRNLSGGTIQNINSIQIGIAPCTRIVTIASGDDDYSLASLNSFFYGESFVNYNGTLIASTMFFQFGKYFCLIDANSYRVITSAAPIPLPDLNNELYVQSICYLSGIIDADTSVGAINYLYALKEDLMEYSSSAPYFPSRKFPYTIAFDLFALSWVTTDINPKQPTNFSTDFTFGTAFITGSLWPTLDNIYFCYMSIMSNGKILPDPNTISTQVSQRHANYYIIDFNYNLVDFVIHFIGSSSIAPVGTSPKMIKSIPYCVIETKPNIITGANPYVFLKNTQIEITGGEITFDNQTLIYEVVNQNKNKLVNYDRGQTGYFGITNLYMLSHVLAEYAQFLEYPTCLLNYTANSTMPYTPQFYTYAVTFEYVNPNGELFRSAPSILQSADITLANDVEVFFTPPAAIETKSNIIIKVWRSTLNATTLYLIKQFTFIGGTTNNYYIDNITTINPDVNIINNELGYFNGGVVPEVPFDPFDTWVLHGNRAYTVTKDNKNILQYSLPYQPGVGMATSFGFEIPIEPRGGDIIELASLDNHLVMFKRNYIYVVSGNGLDALGNNYNFTEPELLNSPVGCSEKSSVIRIPTGIMFKSVKGIYLLDRSLVASYIGAPVERYNDLDISSATLSETENKVRFTCYDSLGTVITYDYFWNTWKIDTGFKLFSATSYLNNLYGIDGDNNVLLLYQGYRKGNSYYKMKCRTPWIKFAGIQGYQRVYKVFLLGDFKNTNVLSVGIMYDYIDEVQDTLYYVKDVSNAYGASQNSDGTDGLWGTVIPFGGLERSNFEVEIRIPNQKCTSICLVISDGFTNAPTDTGNSFQITEILFIAGVKAASTKLPITRRI